MENRLIKYLFLAFIFTYVHPAMAVEPGCTKPASQEKDAQDVQQQDEGTPGKTDHQRYGARDEELESTNPDRSDVPRQKQEAESDAVSVLSFNFLHYMIQKFKFSDVLD